MKDKIKITFDNSEVKKPKKKKQVQQEQEKQEEIKGFEIDEDKKRHDEMRELLTGIKEILEYQKVQSDNSDEGVIHVSPRIAINDGSEVFNPPLPVVIKENQKPLIMITEVKSPKPKRRWFFNIFKYAVIIAVFIFTGSAVYYFIHNIMRLNIIFTVIIALAISASFSFMAKTLFGLVENRESKPLQIQSGQIPLMDEVFDKLECPKCYLKLYKSKIIPTDDGYKQLIKCKNSECDFQKEINIKV